MMTWIYVFFGGGLGSVVRYAISEHIKFDPVKNTFPVATLMVNLLSCFLIGILVLLVEKNLLSNGSRLLLITGFCGGFSTFSAFSNETVALWQNQQPLSAICYVLLSVLGGCLALYVGQKINIVG